MKKNGLFILAIAMFCFVLDLICVFTFHRPIFAIKDNIPYTYKGIFYDTFDCPGYKMPQIKSKGAKFSCEVEITEKKEIIDIIDTSQDVDGFVCAAALEKFYSDNEFSYYWSCIKGSHIIVKYNNGEEENVSEALKNHNIVIEDLDKYKINYYKEPITKEINDFDFYIVKHELSSDVDFKDYYKAGERMIYLSGNLNEFYIKEMEKNITLKEYLSIANQSLDEKIKSITDKLELKDTLRDGGTKIYKSDKKDITMIVCNTTIGDKNVFIGDYKLEYTEGDCKN